MKPGDLRFVSEKRLFTSRCENWFTTIDSPTEYVWKDEPIILLKEEVHVDPECDGIQREIWVILTPIGITRARFVSIHASTLEAAEFIVQGHV